MDQGKEAQRLSKRIKIYMSKSEARMLKRQAQSSGLTIPVYIRKLIHEEIEVLHNRRSEQREKRIELK